MLQDLSTHVYDHSIISRKRPIRLLCINALECNQNRAVTYPITTLPCPYFYQSGLNSSVVLTTVKTSFPTSQRSTGREIVSHQFSSSAAGYENDALMALKQEVVPRS